VFEGIVLRSRQNDGNLSLGAIAEALLFYQNTRIVLTYSSLGALAKTDSLGDVINLVRAKRIQAVFCEETLGTFTNSHGVSKSYEFGGIALVGDRIKQGKNRLERLEIGFRKCGVPFEKIKKLARDFVDFVPAKSFLDDSFIEGGIPDAATIDIQDIDTLKGLLRTGLAALPGGYDPGDHLTAECVQTDLGNFLFTNIDFQRVNRARAGMRPPLEPLTLAHLLILVQESRADMQLAAFYGGDFATTLENSALVRWRQSHLLQRSDLNKSERAEFSEIVLPSCPSVQDVIDTREKSFSEFLRLLDKAEKFKSWLAKANPDQRLVSQYIDALKSDTWADKAPVKALRYLFSFAAGSVDPTGGIASGAADALLLDKLLKGWRPNHFIDGNLKPFLAEER
jgi:hypothetical protein